MLIASRTPPSRGGALQTASYDETRATAARDNNGRARHSVKQTTVAAIQVMFDNPRIDGVQSSGYSEADIQRALMSDFDRSFYCDRYRDINTELVDPLEHYCIFGWKEGRDPCAWFSTKRYMERNLDVAESEFNPFLHYILIGRQEGRRIWPADHLGAFEFDVDPAATLVSDTDLHDLIKFLPRDLVPPGGTLRAECMKIHWVIPDFGTGSGGHMTIFRLIRWLEIAGHDCTIWITNPRQHRTAGAAYEDIIKHFQTIRAPVALADDGLAEAHGDAVIATGWQTVARVLNATGFRQRFYLVQDYEPSFHPVGSYALAAAWTYSQDLACICASPWLAQLMKERHGRWVSQFWLAYDRAIYYPPPGFNKPQTHVTDDSEPAEIFRIALYARRSSARRAVEFAFLALEHLATQGIRFKVDLFGDEITETAAPFPCSSHGVLGASGLAELYRKSHLGICFSATNYSLVPQEMMACGLPVVEIDGESTRGVFPEGVVTMTAPHPRAISEGIEALLRDPKRRRCQAEAAFRWVDQFGWEKSAKLVEQALLEKLTPSGIKVAVRPKGAVAKPAGHFRTSRTAEARRFARAPKVSVCIPTYNGGKLLAGVIERVKSQRAPWRFEIIVVDSSSTDGSIEQITAAMDQANGPLRPADFRLERIPKAEFQHGRTRNLCASLAHGEFIAFLTQDAMPTDEFWLYNLVTVLERFPDAAGAFGRHVAYPEASRFTKRDIANHFDGFLSHPLVMSRSTRLTGIDEGTEAARKFLHFFSDNNACLRRSVWDIVPYPEIDYGEDQVWADQIIALGYEKIFVPSAVVYHSHSYTPTEIAERAAVEAFFFATMFGYEMYDFGKAFQDHLAAAGHADTGWAQVNALSAEELAQRLLENKARLYGRVMGMEKARFATGNSHDPKMSEPVVLNPSQYTVRPPSVRTRHVNDMSFADAV